MSIEAALAAHGLRPQRITLVSPLAGRKGGRLAYRVDLEDGTTVKARDLGDCDVAAELCELRAGIDPAFAPVIARRGSVLIEQWIEGETLGDTQAGARAEEAGALLGCLHAGRAGADAGPDRCDSASWLRTAESDLAILAEGGRLGADEAAAIRGELRWRDPGSARTALIHRDFCPENFVVDGAGSMWVIDNEWLMIGAAEFDLGRTYHRWPMRESAWQRFLRGYAEEAPAPEALDFWLLAAALMGARVLHERVPERLDPLLSLLRRLAAVPA